MSVNDYRKTELSLTRKLLIHIWALLPIIFIIALIVVLGWMIGLKSEQLDALRQGKSVLEAKQVAAENRNRVVAIIAESKNSAEAAEKLARVFDLDEEGAKAVLHMSISDLSQEEQARLKRQLEYIKDQIAANKLNINSGQQDVNVVVMELKPRIIREKISLPGTASPWVKYDIIAEVRGEVMKKPLEKGAAVKAGQTIAVLDRQDYQLALNAAEAAYEKAMASQKRLEKLRANNFAAQSELDDIVALTKGYKAELDKARLDLKRCTITSPIDGIVNRIYIEKGQYANIGDPIAEIMRLDRIKVNVGIPESDVSAVSKVEFFTVKFDALGGRVFDAKKHFLSLASDSAARLYDLELEITNPAGEIRPDMFTRVEIVKQELHDTLSVPLYSIISLNDRQLVYVVNNGNARTKSVKTGIQEGWRIQVTEGLVPGDRLIVVGHRQVSEGQPVNVIRTVSDMEELQ